MEAHIVYTDAEQASALRVILDDWVRANRDRFVSLRVVVADQRGNSCTRTLLPVDLADDGSRPHKRLVSCVTFGPSDDCNYVDLRSDDVDAPLPAYVETVEGCE